MDGGVVDVEDLRLALVVAFVDEMQLSIEGTKQVRKPLGKRGDRGSATDRIQHVGAEALDEAGGRLDVICNHDRVQAPAP